MLRLTAQDGDDLAVISAHMQDAVVKLVDFSFMSKRRQFALVANRFVWEASPKKLRQRSGLHFESVMAVKRMGFANTTAETVLSLLAITCTLTDAPAGFVTLAFSAGHSIRLDVECLDATMTDIGGPWSTDHQPEHVG